MVRVTAHQPHNQPLRLDRSATNLAQTRKKTQNHAHHSSSHRPAFFAQAEDFVAVLGQKVGKAILISDNSQSYIPQPRMYAMKSMAMDKSESAPRETLAIGERIKSKTCGEILNFDICILN